MNQNTKFEEEFQHKLKRRNDSSKIEVNTILDSNQTNEGKIVDILALNVERQEASTEMMPQGFIGLAVQNNELQQKLAFVSNEKLIKIFAELQKPIQPSVLKVTRSTEVVKIPNKLQDYQY